jgi:prepilin-type N-terminal cleavage/methylation domain-containing protein
MRAELRRGPRGFTLLELLVVVGISAITIATAIAVFAAMLNQKRTAERTMEVYTTLAMAQGVMEFDIGNAGWRFPAPASAVRVINGVDTATSVSVDGLGGTSVMTTATNCAGNSSFGLVPGSDILELAQGSEADATGVLQSWDTAGFILKGGTAPLTAATIPGGDLPVVLFASPQGDVMMAKVVSGNSYNAGTRILFTLLRSNFTSGNNYGGTVPQQGWSVYRLGRRTRYFLCRDLTTGSTARPMLFRQQSGDDGDFSTGTPVFQQVQTGVADLQLGLRVADPSTSHIVGGTDCMAAGIGQYCYCNVAGPCTGTDVEGNNPNPFFQSGYLAVTSKDSADQWVRGLVLGLTGVSTRTVANQGTQTLALYLRPALLDHPAATGAGDGNLYLTQLRVLGLRNLTQVIP